MASLQETNAQYEYPFKQQLCIKHRLATRIWRGITDPNQNHDVCNCCNRKTGQKQVQTSCMQSDYQYAFLGPGIPLFFRFSKSSISMLLGLSVIFSIFALYSNITSHNCQHNDNCDLTVFNKMSIVNKKQEYQYLRIQNFMLLTFVICCLLVLQFFRYRSRKAQKQIDKTNVSASDYSIILKRLPQQFTKQGIQQMLKNQFYKQTAIRTKQNPDLFWQDKNIQIQSIILSYDVNGFLQQKSNQMKKFKQLIQKNQQKTFVPVEPAEPTDLGQIAIVVFEEQQTKNFFIHQPSLSQRVINYFLSAYPPLSDFKLGNKLIAIQRAPQPEDILWQNAHITPWERTKRKILLNCASSIFLLAGGFCQYGLALWQTNIDDSTTKTLISTVASITATITNTLLQNFLIYATKWQRMGTQTQYIDVLTFKLILQQFLNLGVFVVMANVIANWSESTLENSLASTITQIMILNAVTPNLTLFALKKFDIIGRVKRLIMLNLSFFKFTQLEANKLFELPKPDFTQKYSYIVKTLWLTAFYTPFVPIVAIISAVGLTAHFLIQKHLFSGSYSVSSKISGVLNNNCIQSLEFTPLIISIGQLLIYIYIASFADDQPSDWFIPIYVCLAISIANIILPMHQFNQQLQAWLNSLFVSKDLAQQEDANKKLKYQDAIPIFEITYQMTYPANNVKRGKRKDTFLQRKQKAKNFGNFFIEAKNKLQDALHVKVNIFENNNDKKQEQRNKKIEQINKQQQSLTPCPLQPYQNKAEDTRQILIIKKNENKEQVKQIKVSKQQQTISPLSQQTKIQSLEFKLKQQKMELKEVDDEPNSPKNDQKQIKQIKKLFEHYEQKKKSNQLRQIQQQHL